MKKIIVFILMVSLCLPALFSCTGENGDSNVQASIPTVDNQQLTPIQAVSAMYAVSQPTKVVATSKQIITKDVLELNCSYEIVTGYVDNSLASVYKSTIEEIRSIEEGGQNDEVKDLIKTTSTTIESIEGKGTRTNGGEWNEEGEVWSIGRGRMAIKLNDSWVKNVTYENHVLDFIVRADYVDKVFGEDYSADMDGDVYVTIVDDGAQVTSIEISYYVKANEEAHLPQSTMIIRVDYTYDIEKITIG